MIFSMNKKFNTMTPSGFPEFTPAEEKVRQEWISVISGTFSKYGFQPITTPLVEREENLLGKGGNPKEIYALKRVMDDDGDTSHSGNTLRFDHTVPLALYVARHQNELSFPFKRYAIGPVFRGERAQKGRFRQFDQCDIDVVGMENLSVQNDAMMPAIIIEIFQQLLPKNDFIVRINNRKIFSQLATETVGVPAILAAVDDLEKIGAEKVSEALMAAGLNKDEAKNVLEFVAITGTNDEILAGLEKIEGKPEFLEGVDELKMVTQSLRDMGVEEKCFKIDLTIARGLDYYTGTVYETNLIGYERLGSICSGGRYEDLASVFTKKKMPGVGISIGLTRLLSQMFDANIVEIGKSSHLDVLFIPADEVATGKCMELAQNLRNSGKKVDVYLEKKKLAKKFDYADKIGVEYVVVIGENELNDGVVQIKNMVTGEKENVKNSKVLGYFS